MNEQEYKNSTKSKKIYVEKLKSSSNQYKISTDLLKIFEDLVRGIRDE